MYPVMLSGANLTESIHLITDARKFAARQKKSPVVKMAHVTKVS
jgi:hypothetical protein